MTAHGANGNSPQGGVDLLLECTLGHLTAESDNDDLERALTSFVNEVATLSPLQRKLARMGAANGLGDLNIKGSIGLVNAAFASVPHTNGTTAARSSKFADLDPWDTSVDGAELLHALQAFICRFLILPTGAADVLPAFVLVTHAIEAFTTAPYIALESATAECGKTRVLEVLEPLTARPWFTVMPSAAVLFRVIEEFHPTMLLDECQALRGHGRNDNADTVQDLLLSGYKRGVTVPRCVGDSHEVQFFELFGPKVFALIGNLPHALATRCIRFNMERRMGKESVAPFRQDVVAGEARTLARKARRWAVDHRETLRDMTPPFPEFLRDRLAETWGPLLAVGGVVGGGWDARLIAAARTLAGSRKNEDARVVLLGDLRDLFDQRGTTTVFSEDVVEVLTKMEERPWPEWYRGKPLTKPALAKLLKGFDIRPKTVRIGDVTARGYLREWFENAFDRYLPSSPGPPPRQGATSATSQELRGSDGLQGATLPPQCCTLTLGETAGETGHVAVVAGKHTATPQKKEKFPVSEPQTVSFWDSDPAEPDPDEEARIAMREGA